MTEFFSSHLHQLDIAWALNSFFSLQSPPIDYNECVICWILRIFYGPLKDPSCSLGFEGHSSYFQNLRVHPKSFEERKNYPDHGGWHGDKSVWKKVGRLRKSTTGCIQRSTNNADGASVCKIKNFSFFCML